MSEKKEKYNKQPNSLTKNNEVLTCEVAILHVLLRSISALKINQKKLKERSATQTHSLTHTYIYKYVYIFSFSLVIYMNLYIKSVSQKKWKLQVDHIYIYI